MRVQASRKPKIYLEDNSPVAPVILYGNHDALIRNSSALSMPELAAQRFAEIAQKWRRLIDSRCAQFIMLQRSGGWRHFYSEAEFLDLMREALGLAEMWRQLAPRPEEEVAPPPEPSASPARRSAG